MSKKILAFISVLLMMSVCASANGDISAVFDITDFSIRLSGSAEGLSSSVVAVNVTTDENAMSADNVPVYSYLHPVGSDKVIDFELLISKEIKSGAAYIWLDSKDFHESTKVFVFNPEDEATLEACKNVDTVSTDSGLYDFVSKNTDALGIDPDNEFLNENLKEVCDALFYEKESINAEDPLELYGCISKCMAYVMIKNGADIEDVVTMYADVLGFGIDEYNSMSESVKKRYAEIVRDSDNKESGITQILSDSIILAMLSDVKNWNDMKEFSEKYVDEIGIDMTSGSDFADIPKSKQYKVFAAMCEETDEFRSLKDIKDSFDDAVEEVLDDIDSSSGSGSGSGFGGGSSSGGTRVSVPDDLTVEPVVQPVPQTPVVKGFSDMNGHFSADAVTELVAKGVISGYEDNTFRPNGNVTRAEFAAMAVRALGITSAGSASFEDVSSDSWYYTYIEAMASNSLVSGYNGYFNPGNAITRQDAAVILSNIISHFGATVEGDKAEFSDFDTVADYAKDAVNIVSASGIMNGDESGFRPLSSITRGEAAITVSRIMKLLNK